MGFSVSVLGPEQKTRPAILIAILLAALCFNLISGPALAGTETGEFCPDCPDWTNLDGWYAQKEAYEDNQMNAVQSAPQNKRTESVTISSPKEASPEIGYPNAALLTPAGSIQGDQVVLDVRSPADYQDGHISAARNLYWKDLQRDGILDPSLIGEALGHAGINETDRLVIYGSSEDEGAAFVFWALSYLGHDNLSLIDGGIDTVAGAGLALTANAPAIAPTNYTAQINPRLRVTPENLESILSQTDVVIVDARDFSDYGMNKIDRSLSLSEDKIYEDSRIEDAETLEDLFGQRLDQSGTAIVYGTPEAYGLFYSLELMGYNATLLDGDWWMDSRWAVSNVM